ncbi:MAG: WD40 repeat domain-containing protein, partial [Planctomycetota bacterium]|nr:WD40 repeat domain-containing protein [Planctomycetota bacterium]
RAWEEADIARMVYLLSRHKPQSGETDLRGFEWFYYWQLWQQNRTTLEGHRGPVSALALLANGSLVSSGHDSTLMIWNREGKSTNLLKHPGPVFCIAMSPKGQLMASGGLHHRKILLWNTEELRQQGSLDIPTDRVLALAFSPDGKVLAAGGGDEVVRIWNPNTGAPIAELDEHQDTVLSLAFPPSGNLLASAGTDQEIKLWDVQNLDLENKSLKTLTGHENRITALTFSSDGHRLFSGSDDGTIRIWNIENLAEMEPARTLKGHLGGIECLAYSDESGLASGSSDRTAKLWDIQNYRMTRTFKGHLDAVISIAFSNDKSSLITGSADHTIKLWDLKQPDSFQQKKRIECPYEVFDVAYSPSGKRLAVGGGFALGGGGAMVWNTETGEKVTLATDNTQIINLTFSPDDKALATGSRARGITLWNAST